MKLQLRDDEHGAIFWVGVVVGTAVMLYGIAGFFRDVADTHARINLGVWVIGLDLAHDFITAPLACVVGVFVTRRFPERVRAPIRFGLFASAIVLFLAWSPLRGSADVTGNDTIQPLNYATATITVLVVVWAAAGAWIALRLRPVARRSQVHARDVDSPRGSRQ